MPEFTKDWFSGKKNEWIKHLSHLVDKPTNALEIGSFEGRSAIWALDNILTHPESTITCIDPYNNHEENSITNNIPNPLNDDELNIAFERFMKNIQPYNNKVVFYLDTLSNVNLGKKYDFIYIDGSHIASLVLTDAVISWKFLKIDGILIFDDYQWINPFSHDPKMSPKMAIDAFMQIFDGRFELLSKGKQVILKKII